MQYRNILKIHVSLIWAWKLTMTEEMFQKLILTDVPLKYHLPVQGFHATVAATLAQYSILTLPTSMPL